MQPSLGLSGVVTGMLALLMYFALSFDFYRRADQKRDKESAAQWYYQAGVLSLKDRDLKGAQSALLALNALQADQPLPRKLLEAEPGLAGG